MSTSCIGVWVALAMLPITVFAQENIGGSYADGEFRLPEHVNPLDRYVISIEDAGSRRELQLPPGVTRITLGKASRPADGFKWTYIKLAADGSKTSFTPYGGRRIGRIEPPTSRVALTDGQVRLRWERVPGAESYELRWKEHPGLPDSEPKKEKVLPDTEKNPWKYLGEVAPGKTYRWSVRAIKADQVMAESEEFGFTVATPWYHRAKEAGLRLQRAETLIETDKKAEAATFGFVRDVTEKWRYNTEFALIYSPPLPYGKDWWTANLKASIEARLRSSGDAKKGDAVRLRLGAEVDTHSPSASTFTSIAAKYETDRSKSTEKALIEVLTTPTVGWIGTSFPEPSEYDDTGRVTKEPPVQVRIRPYFGFEAGRNIKAGTSGEQAGTILRWVTRLRTELHSPWLGRALSIDSALLYVDGTGRYLPREADRRWNRYLSAGVDLGLTENVSLAFRYSVGRDAPKFEWDQLFSTAIGVKF